MAEDVVEGPDQLPPRSLGRPLLAWAVIVAATGYTVYRQATVPPAAREALDSVTFRLQSRLFVGLAHFPGQVPEKVYALTKSADRGPYGVRVRYAILAGELAGPVEARKQLAKLDNEWRKYRDGDPPMEDARMAKLLDRLYLAYEERQGPGAVAESEREVLRSYFGWLGELALAPPGSDEAARAAVLAPARRATAAFLLAGLGFLAALGCGLVLLALAVAFGAAGRLRGALRTGSPFGGIYVETFAVWMVLFLALGWLGRLVPVDVGTRMLVSDLTMLASLAALAWPRLRGVRWERVRADVGLYRGRGRFKEFGLGLVCYAATLPLLVVGVVAMNGLMWFREALAPGRDPFGPTGDPSHPLAGFLPGADWWVWLQVFVGAALVAPLVEETMFRGVLYRHLREASARLGRATSAAASAAAVSLLFAAVHPQGWQGVPPLAALAFGFALAREWRGTLLPAAVAHGVNNAAITLLLVAATG